MEAKRIDIITKDGVRHRAMVNINDNGMCSISNKALDINSPEEMEKLFPEYVSLVVNDDTVMQALRKAGYKARGMVRRKPIVHATLSIDVYNAVLGAAEEEGISISALTEKALRYYLHIM